MRARIDNSHLDSYVAPMSAYSVAEAKNNLPKLLNEALAGEEVTITRRGKPIARLARISDAEKVVHTPDGPTSPYDVEWLRRHLVTPRVAIDAVALVRGMRDEGY
jgi:prevent-host-death family protein